MTMQAGTTAVEALEICHPFTLGTRLYWHLDAQMWATLGSISENDGSVDRDGLDYVMMETKNAAARSALACIADFVGELALEDGNGYRCYGPGEIEDFFDTRTAFAFRGPLDSWEKAVSASAYRDKRAGATLKWLTDGADLGSEEALRHAVRHKLTIQISGCASHNVLASPRPAPSDVGSPS